MQIHQHRIDTMASATAQLSLREWIQTLLVPGYLLTSAMIHYLSVCYDAVIRRGRILAPILESSKVRNEAFGRFWVELTANQPQPQSKGENETTISESADLIPPILSKASGIVLDIGPGTGSQMPFLCSPAIKAIYGPEPCETLHPILNEQIHKYRMDDKYHLLSCSVEVGELLPALEEEVEMGREGDLALGQVVKQRRQQQQHRNSVITAQPEKEKPTDADTGSAGGIFDTILCVRVLCSVPHPEQTVNDLYSLLKPGGKMLITEHVVNPWSTPNGSVVARIMQSVYEWLGWRWFMGDCRLNRDTEGVLRRVAERDGGWGVVELERWFGESVMSYVSGVLVKRDLVCEEKKKEL